MTGRTGSPDRPVLPDRAGLVPLTVIRGTVAGIAVVLGALLWNGSAWVLVPALVAVAAAVLPSIGLVSLSLLLLVVSYALTPAAGVVLLPFVAGLHAAFVLYLLLLPLPLHGWISVPALRGIALSWVRLQAVAQPLAVLALVLGGGGSNLLAVVAGVGALAGWLLWVVTRTGPSDARN